MMKFHIELKFCIIFLIFQVIEIECSPRYQDNYSEDKFLPNFITLGQNYRKALGSTVILPCKLNKTEHTIQNIVAWKHDIAVLTAGLAKITVNPRIRLITTTDDLQIPDDDTIISYNLEIRDVQLTDAGNYVCQIGSLVPKEIYHTLEILIPPKIIQTYPLNIVIDVMKGELVRLECHADGNPIPKILWNRKNNNMLGTNSNNNIPNLNMTSNIFEVQHADRHTIGHYRCTADNGVGPTDTRDFIVNVKYPPELEFDGPFVHTGIGIETRLTCTVYADPIAVVSWYSETNHMEITSATLQHSEQQTRGNFYDLILRNVTVNDLGNYSCQASNSLGDAKLSIILTALPTTCIIDAPILSNYREIFNVTWTVESYSPIREYQLFYRKSKFLKTYQQQQQHDYFDDNHINLYNQHSQQQHNFDHERHYYNQQQQQQPQQHNDIHAATNNNNIIEKWKNIIISENYFGIQTNNEYNFQNNVTTNKRNIIVHKSSYLLRNLMPGTNYEVKIQARNDFGWNKISQIFYFTTKPQQYDVVSPSVLKAVLDKDLENLGNQLLNCNLLIYVLCFVGNLIMIRHCI